MELSVDDYDRLIGLLMIADSPLFDSYYCELANITPDKWLKSRNLPYDLKSVVRFDAQHTDGLIPVMFNDFEHFIAVRHSADRVQLFDPCLPRPLQTRAWKEYVTLLEKKAKLSFWPKRIEWVVPSQPVQPHPQSARDPMCSFYAAYWLAGGNPALTVEFRTAALSRAKEHARHLLTAGYKVHTPF